MAKFVIEGVIKTVSPLHITSAASSGSRYVPGEDGKISYDGKSGFPMTETIKTKIAFTDSENTHQSKLMNVPLLPASGLRGALRRAASSVIEDYFLLERDQKMASVQVYLGMRTGAISGRPDGVAPSSSEIISAQNNVFFGIFGGGPRMLRGRLKAQDALPVLDKLIENGYIPQSKADHALYGIDPRRLYNYAQVIRKDDFIGDHTGSERASEVVEGFTDSYEAEREKTLLRAIEKAKKASGTETSDDSVERGVRAMSFREDVASGVPFYLRLAIDGTEAQVGLLIQSLERMLNDGIGGRKALGFGKTQGTINVIDEEGTVKTVLVGDINSEYAVQEDAEPFLAATTSALEELTMETLVEFTSPAEFAKAEAKKEKAKDK